MTYKLHLINWNYTLGVSFRTVRQAIELGMSIDDFEVWQASILLTRPDELICRYTEADGLQYVCPHCDKSDNDNCYWCHGSGWLSEADYQRWFADQQVVLEAAYG